ncbi:WOX9b [Salix suchowensis]|nr:WOX9b [Salix suchowensis]
MASSNRHWPSLFKSKPCNPHHHQWQHDINPSSLMSTGCHRNPYASVPGCEERSPEPKPRWNPKPEQIRILEAIFNSGMVNPPRDEIRKIRAQLQEYGKLVMPISKHKLRNFSKQQQMTPSTTKPLTTTLTAPSSLSSSSERSSPKVSKRTLSLSSPTYIDASNSPTSSVRQTYFQAQNEFVSEPFFFPSLLNEITNSSASKKVNHEDKNRKMEPQLSYTATSQVPHSIDLAPLPLSANASTVSIQSTINQVQGPGESGVTARSTVFINDVAFEAFGDDILLIHSSGQPVLTNEWGVTLDSLQHGALYYLVPLYTSEHWKRKPRNGKYGGCFFVHRL